MSAVVSYKKGAFQLSLSFIIGVVFAIVLLSLAIFWAQDIFSGFTDISESLKQDAAQKLEETFQETDENYAIWPKRKEIDPGTILAVTAGIKNNAMDGARHDFVVGVEQESGPGFTKSTGAGDVLHWLSWGQSAKLINPNQNSLIPILITVPHDATSGTYIFRITACSECEEPRCPPGGTTTNSITSTACTQNSVYVWGAAAEDFQLIIK
jgi:hypothetical protein